jgi:hypothetical protein
MSTDQARSGAPSYSPEVRTESRTAADSGQKVNHAESGATTASAD